MNREDRAAFIQLGQQFAPSLFENMDAVLSKDELVLSAIGNGYAMLAARVQELEAQLAGEPQHPGVPQPSPQKFRAWFRRQHLQVTRREMTLEARPGGRMRQSYSARLESAQVQDVLSWRYDALTAEMIVVMNDGQRYSLPFAGQ